MASFTLCSVGTVTIGDKIEILNLGCAKLADGVFIMVKKATGPQYGTNRNAVNIIEVRGRTGWWPIKPIEAYESDWVAKKRIEDITGKDYNEVLFCDKPDFRISTYSSVSTNEV